MSGSVARANVDSAWASDARFFSNRRVRFASEPEKGWLDVTLEEIKPHHHPFPH